MVLTPARPNATARSRWYWQCWGWGAASGILLSILHKAWFGNKLGWPCPFKYWTGVPCPTWGMTRSMTAMAQGHLAASLHFHGLGPILFVLLVIAILHLGWECLTRRPLNLFYRPWLRRRTVWIGGLVVYIGYHGTRLQTLAASGELAINFTQSPLGQLLHHSASLH
jgi:Protein of unknown function (DUF2752)